MSNNFSGYLYWFWYHPAQKKLLHLDDGTHTTAAVYELGYGNPNEVPDPEDYDVMREAISDGWVRGRYGEESNLVWDELGENSSLQLHGKMREVFLTALEIWKAGKHFSTLYLDLETSSGLKGYILTGRQIKTFLKTGSVPQAVNEAINVAQQIRGWIIY